MLNLHPNWNSDLHLGLEEAVSGQRFPLIDLQSYMITSGPSILTHVKVDRLRVPSFSMLLFGKTITFSFVQNGSQNGPFINKLKTAKNLFRQITLLHSYVSEAVLNVDDVSVSFEFTDLTPENVVQPEPTSPVKSKTKKATKKMIKELSKPDYNRDYYFDIDDFKGLDLKAIMQAVSYGTEISFDRKTSRAHDNIVVVVFLNTKVKVIDAKYVTEKKYSLKKLLKAIKKVG